MVYGRDPLLILRSDYCYFETKGKDGFSFFQLRCRIWLFLISALRCVRN